MLPLVRDAATGKELHILSAHTEGITSVAYSPDGKTIVTASADQTVLIWDVATVRQLRVLSGHSDTVTSVAYSPDGKTIITASTDQTVRISVANIEDLLAEAQRRIQRDPPLFTSEERQRYGLEL
jgi:WD40 repeat protein